MAKYPGRVDSTPKRSYRRCKTSGSSERGKPRWSAIPEGMMQYLPWLLIVVGVLVVVATLIVARFVYVESD